jgi:prolipoprotein diacylglyceryltransferase
MRKNKVAAAIGGLPVYWYGLALLLNWLAVSHVWKGFVSQRVG